MDTAEKPNYEQEDSELINTVLRNILDANAVKSVPISTMDRNNKPDKPKNMVLINIQIFEDRRDIMVNIIPEIKKLIPNAWIFTYGPDLLVLLQIKGEITLDEELKANITALLDKYDLSACFSDEFSDLFSISKAYNANKRILSLHDIYLSQPRLIEYNKFKIIDLILVAAEANKNFDYMQFVSNTAKKILAYDRANGTNLLYTLYCFITSGSSFVLTAKKMFVHKNTIIYRINRIQQLFNVDLSTDESKFEFFHSCVILRVFGQT